MKVVIITLMAIVMLKAMMMMMIIVVISILFISTFSLTCSSEMSNISHAAINEPLINLLAYHIINIIIICSVMSMYYEVTLIAIQLKPQQLSSQKKMGFRYSSYTISGFDLFLFSFPPPLSLSLLPCTSDKSRASSGSFGAHTIGSYTCVSLLGE